MAGPRVEVDGGILEGGGQILRVSTALSCLLGLPLRVQKIRAGRSTPGLRPQHLSGLEVVRDLCDGHLEGAEIGSTEITFTPKEIRGGTHTADTKTAGFVFVVQSIYVSFCYTFLRGYYPKGGGEVILRMSPVKQLDPINLTDRGLVTKIYGRAFVAGVLPLKFSFKMDNLWSQGNIVAETSTGCLLAGSALGKRGVNADKVGIDAAEMLLANLRHGGAVDECLQDQLIIFMALANGVSRIKTGPVTLHTQTAIHFAEQLAKARFTVKKSKDEEDASKDTYVIECEGIGVTNPSL
uniref:RNA 3'-terminal phosphate cyclase n=1 Tax=Jaculus jaculus TaxID=51337 RepID=A0A8C5KTN2_JACJA